MSDPDLPHGGSKASIGPAWGPSVKANALANTMKANAMEQLTETPAKVVADIPTTIKFPKDIAGINQLNTLASMVYAAGSQGVPVKLAQEIFDMNGWAGQTSVHSRIESLENWDLAKNIDGVIYSTGGRWEGNIPSFDGTDANYWLEKFLQGEDIGVYEIALRRKLQRHPLGWSK